MKLNPDCIRDILLYIEDECTPISEAIFEPKNNIPKLFSEYGNLELIYHLNYALEADLFEMARYSIHKDKSFSIRDLTPLGHTFLADIRNDFTWNIIKEKASKAGVGSLKALLAVGSNVAAELISKQFL